MATPLSPAKLQALHDRVEAGIGFTGNSDQVVLDWCRAFIAGPGDTGDVHSLDLVKWGANENVYNKLAVDVEAIKAGTSGTPAGVRGDILALWALLHGPGDYIISWKDVLKGIVNPIVGNGIAQNDVDALKAIANGQVERWTTWTDAPVVDFRPRLGHVIDARAL